jgi:hypothetical protein
MMIPEKLQGIMKKDGVVAIATLRPDGPHMVNTWNGYVPPWLLQSNQPLKLGEDTIAQLHGKGK